MNLNKTVSVVRDVARTNLRLLLVNEIRETLLKVVNHLTSDQESVNKRKEAYNKKIAICQFQLANLVPEDPTFEERKAEYEKAIETYQKEMKAMLISMEENEAVYQKEIEELEKRINSVEEGETKVSATDLQTESVRLLKKLGHASAKEAVDAAVAADEF